MRTCLVALMFLVVAARAQAATIILDMNGFPNTMGGQVSGHGIKTPIPIKPGEQRVTLENLEAGKTYYIDLFHNAGPGGSDFLITIDAQGRGVESVSRGGEMYDMLIDFKPGDSTLKLKTHEIIFNANNALTGVYGVAGLIANYSLTESAGPRRLRAVPGRYSVDVLTNGGAAAEDFSFNVDSDGNTSAGPCATINEDGEWKQHPNDPEHVVCQGPRVSIRAAVVRFRVVSPVRLGMYPNFPIANQKFENGVEEFDMLMAVGAGGVNIHSFGPCAVVRSDMLNAYGRKFEGHKSTNDLHFFPRLRYGVVEDAYYFETVNGPAQSVNAVVDGLADDQKTEIKGVTLTATIVKGNATAATTQPGGGKPDSAKPVK